jgi:hypothetical protein
VATSGTYNYNLNRDLIIKLALRRIGAIQAGDEPGPQIINDSALVLNALVHGWQATGIHLWTEREATLFLQPNVVQYADGANATETYIQTTVAVNASSGASTITLTSATGILDDDYIGVTLDGGSIQWTQVNGAPAGNVVTLDNTLTDSSSVGQYVFDYTTKIVRPLRIAAARRYNIPSAIDTPLIVLSKIDYRNLPNKLNTGTITQWYYDPARDLGQLYVWPAPVSMLDAVKFTYLRPIQDFDAATDTPDLPQEWLNTIAWGLAQELAHEYDVAPQRYQMVQERAAYWLDLTQGFDREATSVFFGVSFDQTGRGSV